jgi:hypothetical protein
MAHSHWPIYPLPYPQVQYLLPQSKNKFCLSCLSIQCLCCVLTDKPSSLLFRHRTLRGNHHWIQPCANNPENKITAVNQTRDHWCPENPNSPLFSIIRARRYTRLLFRADYSVINMMQLKLGTGNWEQVQRNTLIWRILNFFRRSSFIIIVHAPVRQGTAAYVHTGPVIHIP